jgi:ABC-type glycerol-3-phosphate transport system substrate-binding protein
MQDPNNPNTANTNAIPFPTNDAPPSWSTVSAPQTPVVQQPAPILPVLPVEPAPPISEPQLPAIVAATQPIIAEPIVQEVPQAPSFVAPVIESMPADSYTPPIMASQPVVQPIIQEVQTPPAEPIVQPVPVPVVPLSSNHFPEPVMPTAQPVMPTAQPVMPEMSSNPVPAPVMPPVQSQPLQTPVQTAPIPPAIQPQSPQTTQSILTPPTSNVVSLNQVSNNTAPQPVAIAAADVASAFTKKKSPIAKIAVIAAAILLVLSGILFAIMQFSSGAGGAVVGTKGEITWWGVSLDETDVAPIIEDYKGSHPDVKITYVKQSKADYRERLTNALAKGTGAPDIFEMHNSWQPMFKNDLSTIPSSIMTPDEFKGTFYPVIVTDMTNTKGIIGLPLYYDALTLYVNEDLFSVALKTAPKTWIDVQNLANPQTGITQKDKDGGKIIQSAIALGTTDNVEYWPDILGLMMYQNKASFTNFESPQTKDTLAFYQYFGKTTGNWDSTLPKSSEAFAKGKTAMIIAPASAAYGIIQAAPTLHFKTYTLPQLPKENPSDPDTSYATYWSESVWAKSASKDAAWEFLKYASSGEALQKVNQNLKSNSKPQRAYPIPSLNQQFVNDPILGSIVALAPVAKSWYLADQTSDGKTGLNTQLSTAFASSFTDPKAAQASVLKILNQYGIPVPK